MPADARSKNFHSIFHFMFINILSLSFHKLLSNTVCMYLKMTLKSDFFGTFYIIRNEAVSCVYVTQFSFVPSRSG